MKNMHLYKITLTLNKTVDMFPRIRTYYVCVRGGVVAALNRVLDRVSALVVTHSERKILRLELEEMENFLTEDGLQWVGEVDLGEAEHQAEAYLREGRRQKSGGGTAPI